MSSQPVEVKSPKEIPKTTISISKQKDSKVDIRLANLDLNGEVTFVVTGKIKSMSQDEYGKNLSVTATQVRFIGKE